MIFLGAPRLNISKQAWTLPGLFILKMIIKSRSEIQNPFVMSSVPDNHKVRLWKHSSSSSENYYIYLPKTIHEHLHYARLYATFAYWYLMVYWLFSFVHKITLRCIQDLPIETCNSKELVSFDISGHCL